MAATTKTVTKPVSGTQNPLASTAGYYAAFVVLGLISASLGPTLPGLAEHTRTNLGEISFLFTTRATGYLLGSLVGGRQYDRMPGHPVVAGGLLVIAIMAFLTPLIPLLWLLAAILLLLGMAEGTLDVGGNTLLVWVHRHKVGPFMNGLHFFFGLGAFLSPIIIAQAVLMSGGITWAYWILAVLALPVMLWVIHLPSPVVAKQQAQSTEIDGETNTVLAMMVALFMFLYVGSEVSFGGWIYTYAVTLKLADTIIAAYLTSVFWGALTMGRLAAIPIATRWRPVYHVARRPRRLCDQCNAHPDLVAL